MQTWDPLTLAAGSVIHGDGAVSNLNFHREGRYLLMTTAARSLYMIDCMTGQERKKIYAKSHGFGVVKYTHHEHSVLCSSEHKSHDVRYLSLYDNKYLRYFRGHTDRVTNVSMSPTEDYFLTSSLDRSVLLWNLSNANPVAKLSLPNTVESPYVSYDESGLVFGVLCKDTVAKRFCIKLYDARSYEKGPFQDISPKKEVIEETLKESAFKDESQIQRMKNATWTNMEFSPDGFHILVNTNTELMLLLDGFFPENKPTLLTRPNDSGVKLGTCFSADARYIVSGADDNSLRVYDKTTGEEKHTLSGHSAPAACVKCNPVYNVMASGCVNTVMWIPSQTNA